ncbi:MAG: TVP38/TMEM64 family protein [Corynebacterium sp.]|nr:TVP38/TMEM64 family protein [Corynebacterium sp.]
MSSIFGFLNGLFHDGYHSFWALSWPRRLLLLGLAALVVLAPLLINAPSLEQLRDLQERHGSSFVLVFLLLYIGITQFPIPRTVMTLAGGILFGIQQGVLVVLLATTISAALSFTIVRALLGDWMRPHLQHPAVHGITVRLETRGWWAITSLRMIAAVPFSVLNYTAALTPVPLWGFTIATFVGSLPGTIVTVAFGSSLVGGFNWYTLLWTVGIALVGCVSLYLDAKTPVKSLH